MKKMKKSTFFTVFLSLQLAAAALAQEPGDTLWTQTYGGSGDDYGQSIQQTTDGGYIIAGYTDSFGAGNVDFYLVKTDADGDVLWTQTFGGDGWDFSYSVQQTADGGYIVGGYSTSFGAGDADFYLVKTDADGVSVWAQIYGGSEHDYGHSVRQTADGGYIMTGYTRSFGAGDYDVYLVKTDADGDALWTHTYGGGLRDYAKSVRQTGDGGYIIAGYTESFGAGEYDVYLVKTDADGYADWTGTYGGIYYDNSQSVQQTTDGGYIAVGRTDSFGPGGDIYLVKTDADGGALWPRNYGGANNDYGRSVQGTDEGGYIIASNTNSFGEGGYDIYLIKTDADGDAVWTRTYGGGGDDYGQSVQQTTDGAYIIGGYTDSFAAGDHDVYMVKVAGETAEDIPTLSEWGMIILALLLLAVGTVAVVKRRKRIAVDNTV